MSQERSTLLDKMLGNGAAAGLRGKVQDTKKKLDARGLEHKAAKPQGEAKTKGIIDAMRGQVEAFVGKIVDGAPPELVDGIMAIFMQSAMETPAAAEPAVEEAPMEEMADEEEILVEDEDEEEMMEGDDLEDEEDKALANKATNLFDSLITTQEGIVTDMATITKAIEGLNPLLALVTEVKTLTTKVAALEKQLSNRPRQASRAVETEVEVGSLNEDVRKSLVQKDKFWGANLMPEGVE